MSRSWLKSRIAASVIVPVLLVAGAQSAHADDGAALREEVLAGLSEALNRLTGPDADLVGEVDRVLAGDELACIPVDTIFYCQLYGWSEEPLDVPAPANEEPVVLPDGSLAPGGDLSFEEYLAGMERLPLEEQVNVLRIDLETAIASAGKAIFENALMSGGVPDPTILAAFPEVAPLAEAIATSETTSPEAATLAVSDTQAITPYAIKVGVLVGSTSRTFKQERSYWCGPATAAMFAWNDPQVGNTISHSQTVWAGWLGTTTSGTAITSMVAQINLRLPGWKAAVNSYIVGSVSSWSLATWQSRISTTIGSYHAPLLLHPRLTPSNSSYIPAGMGTSGHFNMGSGYGVENGAQWVRIFEPYSGGGQIPNVVWESTANVRTQNLANALQNIGY